MPQPPEVTNDASNIVIFLNVVRANLIANGRNFDDAIVSSCISIIEKDFQVGMVFEQQKEISIAYFSPSSEENPVSTY